MIQFPVDDKPEETPVPFSTIAFLSSFRRMMTVEEVADLLNTSTDTVYRMARRKQIPSALVGGSRRFDPAAIAVWLGKKDPSMIAAARQTKLAA
jgi:excisionase family DNA binding protein